MPKKQRPVRGVEITVFVHATEDDDKVKKAVKNVVTRGISCIFKSEDMNGYYGDPIKLLKMEINKWKPSTDVLVQIFSRLSSLDQEQLLSEIDQRVDESGNLYLRLDKQKAHQNEISLTDEDPIRLKFKFHIPYKADPVEIIQSWINRIVEEKMPEAYVP